MTPRQCVILVGGLGTRLGELTANCPKPLLPVGSRPFLDLLLWHAWRFGFDKVLLLAGHHGGQVREYAASAPLRSQIDIRVCVEPEPLGTAGALAFALPELEDCFLLMNGDSVFDFNWLDLVTLMGNSEDVQVAMSLRSLPDAARFGVVQLNGDKVTGFRERGDTSGGLINGGVYLMRRSVAAATPERSSLEATVLPQLAAKGAVRGRVYDGFFLDIGVPDVYARAPELIERSVRRPALFLDRDGVLNVDKGHVGTVDRFEWIPGARVSVKAANDAGQFVFVVTNQAGIAKGHYTEADMHTLHAHMQQELRAIGAHVDAIRYCPMHPDGVVPSFRGSSDWRKPEPGMILDLLAQWPVDGARSLLVGDKPSDLEAGRRAGVASCLFEGGRLDQFIDALRSGKADVHAEQA